MRNSGNCHEPRWEERNRSAEGRRHNRKCLPRPGIEPTPVTASTRLACTEADVVWAKSINKRVQPTFYPCTVFRQPCPCPDGALSSRWPDVDCIVYFRTGEVRGDNSITNDFYDLTARWTVHAKICSLRILPYVEIFGISSTTKTFKRLNLKKNHITLLWHALNACIVCYPLMATISWIF